MAEQIEKNSWVEIHRILLQSGERATQVPEDTKNVPLEMRAKGFLTKSCALGEEAEILTPSGRCLHGILNEANPAYSHGFGPPIPELLSIGMEVRAILRKRGLCR